MDFIVIGDSAHLAGFTGDLDDLVRVFPSSLINTLRVRDVKKVVWGANGEYWEFLDEIPAIEN